MLTAASLSRRCVCRGILVKGGRVLDALSGCRTVAFDKTGTLTTGSLVCTSLTELRLSGSGTSASGSNGGGEAGERCEALAAAAALSLRSTHPVSEAVVLMGEREGLDARALKVGEFRLVAGELLG